MRLQALPEASSLAPPPGKGQISFYKDPQVTHLSFFGYFILLWLPGGSETNHILFQAPEEFFPIF